MLPLEKFSFGVGDRFAREASAQLRAFEKLAEAGVCVVPVWNKSHREHGLIGSQPRDVREAAARAVAASKWSGGYHVDADHIRLETVNEFTDASDFFTLDVADFIGQVEASTDGDVEAFLFRHPELVGCINIEGASQPFQISRQEAWRVARKYSLAAMQAGKLYRHIASKKGAEFVTEVSMDETDAPQTPPELLLILALLAEQNIPLQTIAPKFSGRFNKGVDYVGDIAQFERELRDDVAVIAYAVKAYGLPPSLKLSVHSGSDKFSLYAPIRRVLQESGAGLHLKTAGTTWLEEVIGLAEAGGDGLVLAKELACQALDKRETLCAPYASVIDINPAMLPRPGEVRGWSSAQLAGALRHEPGHAAFNPSLRQLLHVAFKLAAQMGDRFLGALEQNRESVERNVTENLFERHLKPLFLG